MMLVRRALLALALVAPAARAQNEPRWTAWVGCWSADSTHSAAGTTVCITPLAKSSAVEMLTITRGAIIIRQRLDANGRPQPIDGNGCKGNESANWSASGRRVYLHAEFSCANGTPGTTTTVFSIMPTGEWLRVEKARAGSGNVVTATRYRPATTPAAVSEATARAIESQQRAILTARAVAAAPIVATEIVDAVNNLDGDVVRAWLAASPQRFDFDATQIAVLAAAGVPSPILDVVGAARVEGPVVIAQPVVVEESAPQMTTMRVCPPNGCNRYSDYNGENWGAQPPYQYPYPYNAYPYSPFAYPYPYTAFVPFSSFVTTNNVGRHNGERGFNHGDKSFGRGPSRGFGGNPRSPTGGPRSPTGGRVVTTGGRRR